MADKVLVANPELANPLQDAPQVEPMAPAPAGPAGTLAGRISLAGGFASHGETARLERDTQGRAKALWLGGTRLQTEARAAKELDQRYGSVKA